MEEKQPRKGGDGKINLDELEKYGDIEVQPELVKALGRVDPAAVETAIEIDRHRRKDRAGSK